MISRITGYLQNLQSWNHSKRQEFIDRHRYTL
ncbi:MAG: anaerobic ribonucleoside-triphosphate reductase [Candidatus Thorarchaeota archaeon]